MTEQELRAIVREAVERHLQGHASVAESTALRPQAPAAGVAVSSPRPGVAPGAMPDASHALFVFAAEADGDGRCLIEPVVACTHCGYCKSYGH
jgi:hypothetical protein